MSPGRARAVSRTRLRFGALALTFVTAAAGFATATGSPAHAAARRAPAVLPAVAAKPAQHLLGRDNGVRIDRSHLFVKFRARPADLGTRLSRAGARINHAAGRTGWTTLDTNDAVAAKKHLEHDPVIANVEYSTIGHVLTVPNDPLYASKQQDYLGMLRMDRAWDLSKGAGVNVGVLDTGVDFAHPDMAGRFAHGVNNGVDDNGYNATAFGLPNDDNGHGTMTSGIIAANINNGRGIAGIAPLSQIYPVKVIDNNGSGTSSWLVDGLEHVASLGPSLRPKVVSMSIGGYGDHAVICQAVQDLIDLDIVVVVAAGNSFDQTVEFPSGCPGVISVAATTHTGALASFSTYGTQIDIAAPGEDITSTTLRPIAPSDYGAESGTSFATPIVAGVAALIRSQHPEFTAQQTIDRLLSTARDVGPPGVDKAFGHGIVDPVAALGGAPLAPHPALASDGNDAPKTAEALPVNTAHGAFLAPETDEDWYSLTLSPGWYTVQVPVGLDSFGYPAWSPSVELYDANDHFLAASRNYMALFPYFVTSIGDIFEPLQFHVASSASYRLRVRNVAGNAVPYTITILPTAAPSPLAVKPIPFLVNAQSTAVGNLDDDSRKDVALLMGDGSNFCDVLFVMHQTPEHGLSFPDVLPIGNTFTCPPSSPVVPGTGLIVADATGDGLDDAVFPVPGGVAVMPQVAGAGLDPGSVQVLNTGTVRQIAIADVDGDGHNDLVAATSTGVKIYWDMNVASPQTVIGASALSVAIGEVSGGNKLDIAATTTTGVSVAVNARARSFAPVSSVALAGARSVAVDRAEHVVVTQSQGTSPGNVVAYTVAAGALQTPPGSTVVPSKPGPVAVGDLDGDGVDDAVTAYDSTTLMGDVPSITGTEVHGDWLGQSAPVTNDARSVAVGDVLGAGAPEGVMATTDGLAIMRHRTDNLTTDHGSRWLDDVVPAAEATGVSGTDPIMLALTDAATNADGTTVRLLDASGAPVAADVSGTTTVTLKPHAALNDGAYTIAVDGLRDAGGNTIDGFRSGFIVGAAPDETAPSMTLSGPSGFQPVNHATLTFSTNDGSASLWCSRDNEMFHPCASPVAMSNLTAAAHTFAVFARDTAGNESTIRTASWTHRPPPHGYWMLGAGGAVYKFGTAPGLGSASTSGAVDIDVSPTGFGYWIVDSRGRVFAFGDAGNYGGAPALPAGETVTSISRTKSGRGYWLFTNKGRAITRGDAKFFGDKHTTPLNGPVLDSVATPSGNGYYMVASDGGVFAFGDARYRGSMSGRHVTAPVRTLTPDADGDGYWLVGRDGGVYSFNATFRGGLAGKHLNKPIVGAVPFGNGYLMVASDGGVFNFSNRAFFGSLGSHPPALPIVSIAAYG
jgi:subtilisin family serine protease